MGDFATNLRTRFCIRSSCVPRARDIRQRDKTTRCHRASGSPFARHQYDFGRILYPPPVSIGSLEFAPNRPSVDSSSSLRAIRGTSLVLSASRCGAEDGSGTGAPKRGSPSLRRTGAFGLVLPRPPAAPTGSLRVIRGASFQLSVSRRGGGSGGAPGALGPLSPWRIGASA